MSDSDILSRISILLDANTASFETGMQGARETATTEFGHISSAAKNMAVTVAGAFAVDKIIDAADGYTQIGSRIKRSTADAEEYAMVQARILETANQTYRPLVEAQETYLATSAGLKEMGKNTSETLDIIDSLSYAYTMNAANAEQVASANEWLSKSMIDNKVSGDAFKSMTLAADNLIQDLADHTGKSTIEIKKLGNAGKISLKDLMDTLQGTVDKNKALAAEMPNSWKDGITAVENNFNSFIGKANETYEITGILSGGLITLSEHMEGLAVVATAAGAAYGTKRILEYADSVKLSIVQNIARAQALAVERQALVSGAAAEVSRTAAIATNMQAQVAAAQAEALRLTGMQRIAFVERTLIPLQAAATVATNAEAAASRVHTAALGAETVASTRLAVAKRALMGLVGGPLGLISLGVGLAATMYMVSKSGDQANDTLENQSKYAGMAADELDRLEGAQRRAAKDELSKAIDIQSLGIKKLENDFEQLAENIMDSNKSNEEAARIWAELRAGAIDVGEAFGRLNKLETISSAEINKASELHNKWKEMNGTLADSKTKLETAGLGIKNVAKDSATAAAAIFNLNDEIDKLFKQSSSTVVTATATAAMAMKGYDDKLIGIINKYLQVEGATFRNAQGKLQFYPEVQKQINAEYLALMKQDSAITARNEKEKERAKILEQQGKILQVNSKVQANAAKYNYAGLEQKHGLLPGLLSGINMQESKGEATAVGPQTKYGAAKGGFQMLDGTAKRFGLIGKEVFNTGKSAEAAAKYLEILYKRYGNWEKVISAYHAGEGNVDKGTNIGPVNRQYVKNVKGYVAGASGMKPSTDFSIDDAMKAQEEYLQFQAQQAEKRKQLEMDVASNTAKIRSELAAKIEEIEAAGFSDDKTAKLKAEYQKRAEIDIQISEAAHTDKISGYSDYLKSEEQLLNESFARRQRDLKLDLSLTEDEYAVLSLSLEKQRDEELKKARWRALEVRQAMEDQIKGLSSGADEIFARATMSPGDYESWSLENSHSNAQVGLKNQRIGVEQDILTSSTYSNDEERYQALLDAHKEYRDGMAAIDVKYTEDSKALAEQQKLDQLNLWSGVLGQAQNTFAQLTQSVKDSAGEQSATYKIMFAMQQAFSVASSLTAAWTAYAQAFADPSAMTLPQKIAGGATVMAALMPAVTTISSIGIDGMAHDGIDNIPEEGTWFLDKGERIVDRRTNADLKDMIAKGGASKAPNVNVYTLPGETADVSWNDGRLDVRIRKIARETINSDANNPNSGFSKAMKRNFTVDTKRV